MLLHLHIIVGPLEGFMHQLLYLSRMSRWRAKHKHLGMNDFLSLTYDYPKRMKLHAYVLEKENLNGPVVYLEFGVAKGESYSWWVKNNTHAESSFVGFDTFTGLPEDWNVFKKGDMSAGGFTPAVDDQRASFEVGLFQDTLPGFVKKHDLSKRLVIHIDGDLYSSAYYALNMLAPYMKKDDVIIFDEFGVPTHEFKVFEEFFASHYKKYEVLGAVNNYLQLAIKISE